MARRKKDPDTIVDTAEDVGEGFKLYERVAEQNELGLNLIKFD